MNDYFKSLQIDSSALTAEEIQMINDWDQKHKHGERSISLRSAETQEEFNAFYAENKSLLKNICILWEDEESNYAGICTDGIMRGKIMFVCHEFLLYPIPVFRNIETFLKAVDSQRISDLFPPQLEFLSPENNPFDYPSIHRSSEELNQDILIAENLWKEAISAKDDNRVNLLFSFIQIASPNQISCLQKYLSDAELLYYILCAYKFYGYQEDSDILLRIGKENKQYRKLLKELGASPKKLLWIEKWC